MSLKMLQLNCARAAAVMHDLGQHIPEHKINVVMLQEPWAVNDCVRGLPSDMRVFTARGSAKPAVVINGTHLDCVHVESLTNEWAYVSQSRGL